MKNILVIIALCLMTVNTTKAQFFKRITEAVGSVVNTGVQVTTAPYEVLINTGKVVTGNANPSDIYKPYQEVATSAGAALPQAIGVINEPQRFLMQKAQEFSSEVGGSTGEFIFDIGTFSNRYYSELASSGAQNINGILHGQNPFQLTAAPLAAAIRAARERYVSTSRPLPDDVKNALREHFSASTLNRVRYTIGKVEITLPSFIGKGAEFMGEDRYAVTVDDIIVFNTDPGSFNNSSNWWAHEITHVQQYENLGVELFAYNYARDGGGAIEREAVSNANRITSSNYSITSSSLNIGSFDMSSSEAETNIDYKNNPEYYVAQCIFPDDPFGAMYLVTNYGRIIAVNPINGTWHHIGYSTPPLLPNVAWTYDLPNANWKYAVGIDGNIYTSTPVYNGFGQIVNYNWFIIGYVVQL